MKTEYNSTRSTVEVKSGDHTRNNSIRRKWSALALGGFLFTSIFALSAPPVEAQCKQWNVGHGWRFKQGTLPVEMNLQQKGIVVTGTASHIVHRRIKDSNPGFDEDRAETMSGDVDGTVKGDRFAVRIHWNNNTVGVYEGTIGPSGRIEGKGYEQSTPRTKVRWYSETHMVCADDDVVQPTKPAPPPTNAAPPRPPPIKSSGKAVSAAAPTISANPIVVTAPDGQSQGTTTLTWDVGPDHPNAIVWSRVGIDGKVTVVDTRGKGTLTVAVDRGRNYQFILMETGQQLAKAVVISKP